MGNANFYKTQSGEIYGGLSKHAIICAIKQDYAGDVGELTEIPGSTPVAVTGENEEITDEVVTLADIYGNDTDAREIARDYL